MSVAFLALFVAGCQPVGQPADTAPSNPPLAQPEQAPNPDPLPLGLAFEVDLPVAGDLPGPRISAVVAVPEGLCVEVIAATEHPAGWRTSSQVAESTGAWAVINGGYFSAEMRPLGLVVSNGKKLNPLSHNSSPVFAVIDGRPQILAPDDVPDRGVEQAVQCGPRLVRDGQPTKLKDSLPTRRSAAGLDADGQVILAATTQGVTTLAEFAKYLALGRDEGGIGCREAMNLDGGPSTGFVVRDGVQADGPQPMPSHVVILAR